MIQHPCTILHFDPEEGAVPVAEAARIAGVTESTVHMWVTRGYLDATGTRQKVPGLLFRGVRHVVVLDVLIAEEAAARRGRGRARRRAA